METSSKNIELNKDNIGFLKEFNFENLKYLFKFGKSSNNEEFIIYAQVENIISSEYYQNSFTLQQLQQINKCFRLFDTIDETIENFKDIISEKKLYIKKINDGLSLTFKINKIGKGEEEINLELKKRQLGTEKIIGNLVPEINNLNLGLSAFENEIKTLKNENENFNLEISSLKSEINNLKNENKNIKEEITSLKNENKNLKDENQILNLKFNDFLKKHCPIEFIDNLSFKRNKELKRKIIKYELIYRGSRDGMNSYSFHQKANSISPTISIIETTKGFKFGGYTEKTWGIGDSYGIWLKDDNCFVFYLWII